MKNQMYSFNAMVQTKKQKEQGIPPSQVTYYSIAYSESLALVKVQQDKNIIEGSIVYTGVSDRELNKDWN